MVRTQTIKKLYGYIFSILIIFQIVYIIVLNYTKSYGFLDADAALAIRHAIEMWKNGLFIEKWFYFSTTEIDCISFFAAPLYMITNNLNFAMGSIHCIVILIFLFVIRDLFKNLKLNSIFFKIFTALLFTIYTFGPLDYANMIFLSVGQYGFRILAMLVLINCIITENDNTKKSIFFKVFSLILNAWVSLSSGNYLLLMVLLPVTIACFFITITERKCFINKKSIFLVLNISICILCWFIKNRLGAPSFRNNINIISADKFIENISNCITGIFMLFGGLTLRPDITILSRSGIIQMLKFVVPIICVYISIKGAIIAKKQLLSQGKILIYGFSIIFINFSILCLTNTTYGSGVFEFRYHLISCAMLFLCTAVSLDIWSKYFSNKLICVFFFCGILILLSGININSFLSYKSYQSSDLIFERELVKYSEEYNVDRVYIMGNKKTAYITNVLDYNRVYSSVEYEKESKRFIIDVGNFYLKYQDALQDSNKVLLVSTNDLYEELPSYIKESFQLIGNYIEYNIYSSDDSKIDGLSGINPDKITSYDYPFSPNYIYDNAEMNEDGILVTNTKEGFALWGPYTRIESDVNCDIVLEYEFVQSGEEKAYFDVYIDSKEQIAKAWLDSNSTQAVLKDVYLKEGNIAEFRIWKSDGCILKIKRLKIIPK